MPETVPKHDPKQDWNPVIKMLSNDVHKWEPYGTFQQEHYSVWNHVPNLGKRYELFIYRVTEDNDIPYAEMQKLVEKYKKLNLEVSINKMPDLCGEKSWDYMVSSMWMTKGHKEP